MRSNIWLAVVLLRIVSFAAGQALTPAEIKNPQMRALQEKHFQQLQAVGAEIQGHLFPYPFYFSRVLDLELAQQERADQRSLRFDNYGGMTVVELTGNYFGSYSKELVNKSHRALRTFQDVMLPILQIAVAGLKDNPDVEGFAMEISHHARGQTQGMNMESPENLVLALSKDAAVRLASAKSETDSQAALLDGQFFFNGEPFILYLSDRAAEAAAKKEGSASGVKPPGTPLPALSAAAGNMRPAPPAAVALAPPIMAPRDTSPESLAKIQLSAQKLIDVVVKELDSEAHFVTYAPPVVVAFRRNAYLEFSLNTALPAATAGSTSRSARR